MVTHEIGQWCAYPDFNQISKYIGVLKPYNYELLEKISVIKNAWSGSWFSHRFRQVPSSSKKEEFESYFRTPGFGGYHLLQLNDFPGQGTSPVGVVDVFYDAKPYVDAQTFKQIQSPCLPLLRTDKLVWSQNETFEGDAQVANFWKKN